MGPLCYAWIPGEPFRLVPKDSPHSFAHPAPIQPTTPSNFSPTPTLDNYNPILGCAHAEDLPHRSTRPNVASQAVHLPYSQITRPSSNNLDSSHPPSTTFAARLDEYPRRMPSRNSHF
ncbi:hypothetical protein NMY22_g7639 [Coprinellus aureogranulatus]|nr:hypothetical protein NMY22_g7639 [Coprinellus aureogranulatus]